MLAVARAYETWWSMSLAGPDDDYIDPARFAAGAEAARAHALDYYTRLAASGSSPMLRSYSARLQSLLERRIDTQHRAFYCIYD